MEANTVSLHSKLNHKLNGFEIYCTAKKYRGFQLRITGDIDDPATINQNPTLLSEWISLSNKVGTAKPILYVTANQDFAENKKDLLNLNSNVEVAVHGYKHIYYSKVSFNELETDLKLESSFSNLHRFPFLDWDLALLNFASQYFTSDSSIVSTWMFPFQINNMIEYPICSPTDTALRNKPLTRDIVKRFKHLVNQASKKDRPLTFLFHPNFWSIKLLRELAN